MEKTTIELIKDLRGMTHASINDCKQALEEVGGDMDEAVKFLRKRGLEIALSKKNRVAQQGRVEGYIHLGNKIGVLLEVNCETDFVARNEDFCRFTKDLAMQIAANNPKYIKKEDVPGDVSKSISDDDKEDFYKNSCLFEQAFIKNLSITIGEYLNELIGKIGENIVIRRFVRYQIGEE